MLEDEPYDWYSPGGLLADLLCEIMTDAEIGHFVQEDRSGRLEQLCKRRLET